MTETIHGLRCWDEDGNLTFDINIQTIRSRVVLTIPSGSTGSIALSELPSGLDGVSFIPVLASSPGNVAPYTWVAGARLNWRQGIGAYYLMVTDMSGLGGSTAFDGDSQ